MSENPKYDIRALFGQDEDDDDDEPIPARNPGAAAEEDEEEEADPTRTVLPAAAPKKAKPSKKAVVAPVPAEKKVKRLAEELSEMRFEKDKLEKLHEYSKVKIWFSRVG
jgi:hypothetical protein